MTNDLQKSSILYSIKRSQAPLLAVLVLSAFTHLLNPAGFPDIFYDEGIYMRRAMHVLEGLGPQESTFYDHPYFGQLFLASVFWLAGYPSSLEPAATAQSVQSLYVIPRVLMGALAVVDTFLTYKIAEMRYGRKVAIIASLLFAVMPITWLTRRILLDSILLPFLLSSILMAIYAGRYSGGKRAALVLAAGVLLGVATFTKVPAFTMMPLVAYLAYKSGGAKYIGILLAPAVAIPLLWPVYSASIGQFDRWQEGVLWQAQRESAGIGHMAWFFMLADPVLFSLGAAGFIYAGARKDLFIMLWILPFLAFISSIGYTQYFHWIPVLPVFSIAAAQVIERAAGSRKLLVQTTVALSAFGLVSTTLLVTTNLTSAQFEAAAFATKIADENTTAVASPSYSWLYMYIFDENSTPDYRELLFRKVKTDSIVLIADRHFMNNIDDGWQLKEAYEGTENVAVFYSQDPGYRFYPYTNLNANLEGKIIEVRAN